jgi:hypothetical protein
VTRRPAALARVVLALTPALGIGCRPAGLSAGAAAAAAPIGTYGIELPNAANESGALAGRWALTLAEGGRFTVTRGGQTAVEGRYRVAADSIVFSGESGPFACPDAETGAGTYRWRLGARELTLTPLTDGCEGRRATFAARPLTRPAAGSP